MTDHKRNILVTGADGFIGSHLTEALVSAGHSVRAMVMYNSFDHWGWLDRVPEDVRAALDVFPADIRDPHYVSDAVKGVDTVFHLASLIAIPFSYRSPDSYVDTNIKGTLNLLQASKNAGVSRFVHTSTSEVYGTAQYVPIDEKHPVVGQSPYSATKIAADQLAESFYRSYDLPVVTVRPFNTYGPRQSARAIIPTIIGQILSGKTELSLGSLSPRRDLTYVMDTVSGFVSAMDSENAVGEIINLGTGEDISIGDLVDAIARTMNRSVSVVTVESRVRPEQSEVERLMCDNTKARELLKWQPTVSLVEGLAKTVEWFEDPENLAGYKTDRYVI